MRLFVASAVGVFAVCASAHAEFFTVASNLPAPAVPQGDFMVQDGTFSDSLNSGGTNWYGLGCAQGFTTVAGYTLDRLTVWGASEYLGSDDPSAETSLSRNITGFQVVLMKQNAQGAYITQTQWMVSRMAVTQTATGNYTNNSHSPVFSLEMNLPGSFLTSAGTYYVMVGAVLADGDADAWQWINGQWDGTDPSHPYIATTGDTPTSWGQWAPISTGISGSMLIQSTVPGPGALALLAAGGIAGGRRRRR